MAFNPGSSSIAGSSDVVINSPATDHVLSYNGGTAKWGNKALNMPFESFTFTYQGAVATATGTSRQYVAGTYIIDAVYAGINTSPTGAALIADVKKNGASIFGNAANRPTIAVNGHYAMAGSITATSLAAGDYLTVDVVQVGSSVAGSDLTVTVRLKKA